MRVETTLVDIDSRGASHRSLASRPVVERGLRVERVDEFG